MHYYIPDFDQRYTLTEKGVFRDIYQDKVLELFKDHRGQAIVYLNNKAFSAGAIAIDVFYHRHTPMNHIFYRDDNPMNLAASNIYQKWHQMDELPGWFISRDGGIYYGRYRKAVDNRGNRLKIQGAWAVIGNDSYHIPSLVAKYHLPFYTKKLPLIYKDGNELNYKVDNLTQSGHRDYDISGTRIA